MSSPAQPPDDRKDIVLHIGSGKTGTSSIQTMLRRNRQLLLDRGILYPRSPGGRRHTRLGLSMRPEGHQARGARARRRQSSVTPAELRSRFEEQLFAEMAEKPVPRVLLSDEALYGADEGVLLNLRRFTDGFARSVRVVVYVRRQDDHLSSRYQQVVKREGEIRTLAERMDQLDLARVYDYHARLVAWRDLVRPEEMVVRPFDRASFSDGSLLQDFLEAARLAVRLEELQQAPMRNESLDAESVEFLRLLNLHGRTSAERLPDGLRARVIRRLERASTGPTLTLPGDHLDRFMALWEESNRAVAREFVAGGSETLFQTPRKTRNTTTEQPLDPARLDHFIELLELPEQLHQPLRRLAEQESDR